MLNRSLATLVIAVFLAGCARDPAPARAAVPAADAVAAAGRTSAVAPSQHRQFASLPDRGELVSYDGPRAVRHTPGETWHRVQLSEAHALAATLQGELLVKAPDGTSLRFRHQRHVEHRDGNWTWIGRGADGREAILTFGPDAAFGQIPMADGKYLKLAMAGGAAWMVEDVGLLPGAGPHAPDALVPPIAATGTASLSTAGNAVVAERQAAVAVAADRTVDLLAGYTPGFATAVGGSSAAVTRITHLVDLTNQAYFNSGIDASIRLVRAMQVSYPDANDNAQALYELTGVTCTDTGEGNLECVDAPVPAALQPLVDAREQVGADLVSLLRRYNSPENMGCGTAWVLGGGGVPIVPAYEAYGYSVVSDGVDDGSGCEAIALAHELGHNLGQVHNIEDSSQPGTHPYSYGYREASSTGFYTVMAYPTGSQFSILHFANPHVAYAGRPTGVEGVSDNALSINQTAPIVAGFRSAVLATPEAVRNDIDGDGNSDLLWHNATTNGFTYWLMQGSTLLYYPPTTALAPGYKPMATGDFNGDRRTDIVWSNGSTLSMRIAGAAGAATWKVIGAHPAGWKLFGAADLDGDGNADLLWHHPSPNRFAFWRMSGSTILSYSSATSLAAGYAPRAVGDFNGDRRGDLVWSNGASLSMRLATAGGGATWAIVGSHPAGWNLFGAIDISGDGKDDLLWHHPAQSRFAYWRMNGSTPLSYSPAMALAAGYVPAASGDFDGNGYGDLLWTNGSTLSMRLAGPSATASWKIIGAQPQGWKAIGP